MCGSHLLLDVSVDREGVRDVCEISGCHPAMASRVIFHHRKHTGRYQRPVRCHRRLVTDTTRRHGRGRHTRVCADRNCCSLSNSSFHTVSHKPPKFIEELHSYISCREILSAVDRDFEWQSRYIEIIGCESCVSCGSVLTNTEELCSLTLPDY